MRYTGTARLGKRTKDLVKWERLPDLKSRSAQQRNVVLHPELVQGRYAVDITPVNVTPAPAYVPPAPVAVEMIETADLPEVEKAVKPRRKRV